MHPLVHGAMSLVSFIQILLFAEANGHTTLFAARLRRAGWPTLPWEAIFERRYGRYQSTLCSAIACREIDGFIAFMLDAWELAIDLRSKMISVMATNRLELKAALIMCGIKAGPAPRNASDFLSGVLVVNVRRHGESDFLLILAKTS